MSGWVKLPSDPIECEAALRDMSARDIAEFLDVDLHTQLRDAFPDATDAEIADVIARCAPVVHAHAEQQVQAILRKHRQLH